MKISAIEIQNDKKNINKTSFKGLEHTIDDKYSFYVPPYDKDKYDILLEVCPVVEDGKGGFKLDESVSTPVTINKSYNDFRTYGVTEYPRSTVISNPYLSEYMGYRFRLVDKEDAKKAYKNLDAENQNNVFGDIETKKYIFDPGTRFHDEKFGDFTIISNKMGVTPKSGSAIHVFYDSYTSGRGIDRSKFIRNHFNKALGDLDGIFTNKHEELSPYRYVMSNPYIGADSKSSHKYWGENFFRVPSLAVFKKVLVNLYKEGKGYIADGAFTSQSIQSPFFQDVLKNGRKSPYYDWFKIKGDLKIGIFPDKIHSSNAEHTDPYQHIGFKIINPMGMAGYDHNKPSYIQFFDNRLASTKQQRDTKNLITNYDIPRSNDHYDITTHQDSIQPFFFELDYSDKGVRDRFSGYDCKMLTDRHKIYEKEFGDQHSRIIDNLENFFSFPNYDLVRKGRAAGADFWDGNVDLVKMNLSNPNSRRSNVEGYYDARDYLYNTATYWTQFANNALVSYIAKCYTKGDEQSLNEIAQIAEANDLPMEEVAQIFKNAEEENPNENDTDENAKYSIMRLIDDFRYESLDLSPQLQAVVSTPAFRKYMNNPEVKGLLAEFIVGALMKMEDNYVEEILTSTNEASDVISSEDMERIYGQSSAKQRVKNIDSDLSSLAETTKLTEYGKTVIELLAPTIIGYALTKAIYPDEILSIDSKQGTLKNSQSLKNASLYQAGVVSLGYTNDDAKTLVSNIVKNLSNKQLFNAKEWEFANALEAIDMDKYSHKGIKFAREFVQKTRGGLNWRFDAAKDVADLTATRNGLRNFEDSWDDVIEFWGKFVENVREINPSAYVVAEVTDLWPLYNNMGIYRFEAKNDLGEGATNEEIENRAKMLRKMDWGKYIEPDTAERMLYEKTGATTGSQYSKFFGLSNNLFARNFETGDKKGDLANMDSLKSNIEGFLTSGPLLSITHSHIFWDNHDKPRGLHGLALDMGVFLSRFGINIEGTPINSDDVKRAKEAAYRVLGKEITQDKMSYDLISSKAVAAGDMFRNGFEKVLGHDKEKLDIIYQAISDLASGKFKDKTNPDFIRAEAFGQTAFEISINDIMEQAQYIARKEGKIWFNRTQTKEITDKTFAEILKPALTKMIAMTDFLNSVTGTPFFYAGNNMGLSGYEYASKNVTQQNRNLLRREWIDKNSKEYKPEIRKYFDRFQASCALYKEYGLSAIASGTPISMPQKNSHDLYAILKYDKKGSNVIHVFSNKGITADPYQGMYDMTCEIPYVKIEDSNGVQYRIKDSQGKDTYLKRKVYDETKAKFVDELDSNGNPVKYVVTDGKLRREDGKNIVLNDTVTTFYKPLVESKVSHQDIMQLFHVYK